MLNLSDPLAVLATRFPWDQIEATLAQKFEHQHAPAKFSKARTCLATTLVGAGRSNAGHPKLPVRLMASLLYLKHSFNLSDEELVVRWSENILWRFFSGVDYFEHRLPSALRTPAPVRHQRRGARDRLGLLSPAQGTPALDHGRARTRRLPGAWHAIREPGNRAPHAKKNDLKPWRRVMWCIGALTEEYRARMYALLELYARPISKAEPVICIDEKSLQLINHSRAPLAMATNSPSKQDYEYVRNGTTNLFVAVELKAGRRIVSVTERRGKFTSSPSSKNCSLAHMPRHTEFTGTASCGLSGRRDGHGAAAGRHDKVCTGCAVS